MTCPCNATRLALVLLLTLALPVRAASAHPRLLRAMPAGDSRLTVAPREIVLTFHEDLSVRLCRLTLLDAAQHSVTLDSLRTASGDAKTLTVKILGTLRPGRYTVKWQAAGADGHPVRGAYSFVVEANPVRPVKGSTPPADGGAAAIVLGVGGTVGFRAARR
jgi:methionine-rich copper-binding protein CopC